MSRPRKKDTHLPPCVHWHHGAYYHIKRNVWVRLGVTLAEALEKYASIVESGREGGMPALIAEALPVITRGKAKTTASQYEIAARKLSGALRRFEPRQVMPRHIARIKRSMVAKPNMANRVLTVARLIFNYALEEEIVDTNPAVGIARLDEKHRDRLPSPEEYAAVYEQAGPRLQVIMELLRYGGQRTVDTLRIPESNVLAEGIRFRQQKTGAYLIVGWSPGLRSAVTSARALHGKVRSLYLIPSRGAKKPPDYRSVRDQWEKACAAAKVENLHLHDLRAMSATQAEDEGKNPTALLGHTSPQQTRRYLRGRKPKLVKGPEF